MDYENLKVAAERITMPGEMKHRIVMKCRTQIAASESKNAMKGRTAVYRKISVALVALLICVSLTVTALSATGVLKGYFRDITNGWGAITGTAYEQASDEISMDVSVDSHEMTVLVTFADPRMFPYREAERLSIAAYRILDDMGGVVQEGQTDSVGVDNGQAAVIIGLNELASGSYKLIVTAFESEKKADQPLTISGSWECSFVY